MAHLAKNILNNATPNSFPRILATGIIQLIAVTLFLVMAPVGVFGQTAGQIYKPATGEGKNILDPNGTGNVFNNGIPFKPLPQLKAEPVNDTRTGAGGGHTDLVSYIGDGDLEDGSAFMYYDAEADDGNGALLFRVFIAGQSTASKGYSFLFNTDIDISNGPKLDNLSSANPGDYAFEVVLETNNRVAIYELNENGVVGDPTELDLDGHFQKALAKPYDSDGLGTPSSNPGHFYDFYVPISAINGKSSFSSSTPFCATVSTITRAQSGIDGTISDIMGINDSNYRDEDRGLVDLLKSCSAVNPSQINTGFDTKTSAPTITGLIGVETTIINGVTTEEDLTSIDLEFSTNDGSSYSTLNSSNFSFDSENLIWSVEISTGTLSEDDLVRATATATDKTESAPSSTKKVFANNVCYVPPPLITGRNNGATTVSGTWSPVDGGNAEAGRYRVDLYEQLNAGDTPDQWVLHTLDPAPDQDNFVTTSNTWAFDIDATGNLNNQVFYARVVDTQENCTSAFSGVSDDGAGSSVIPGINTDPIQASSNDIDVEVVNNDPDNASTLYLYVNGQEVANSGGTVAANGGTAVLTITGGAPEGSFVTARAQATGTHALSNESDPVMVSAAPDDPELDDAEIPVIVGDYINGDEIVQGFSSEDAGATITIYDGGTGDVLGTGTVDAFGNWDVQLDNPLQTGDTFVATAKISGKNESAESDPVTVQAGETAAPTIEGGVTEQTLDDFNGDISISGSGEFRIYIDGELLHTTTSASVDTSTTASNATNNPDSKSIGQLLQPSVEVHATAQTTGNTESDPSNIVEVLPPDERYITISSISDDPANSGGGVEVTITFLVLDQDFAPESDIDLNFSVEDGGGTLSVGTGTTTNGEASVIYTTAEADNGSFIGIRAKDGETEPIADPTVVTFEVEEAPPVIDPDKVTLGNDGSDNIAFSFESDKQLGSSSTDIAVSISGPADGAGWPLYYNRTNFDESGSGPYTYTLNVTQAYNDGDGTYTATINDAIDTSGKDGADGSRSDNYTLVSDTEDPVATISSPSDGDLVQSQNSITGNATDNVGVIGVELEIQRTSDSNYWDGTTFQEGQTTVSASGTFDSDDENWTYDSSAEDLNANDTYTVTATASDDAGNTGSSTSVSYVIDATAPGITNVSLSNDGSDNLTITFHANEELGTDPADLAITVDGPDSGDDVYSFDRDDFTGTEDGGTWTYTLDLDPNQAYDDGDGEYTVSIDDALDTAGNDGADGSDTDTYSLDTTAPEISEVSLANDGSKNVSLSFNSDEQLGTGAGDLAVSVIGPNAFSVIFDRDDFTKSGTGPYTYTLNAEQAYGNDGTYTATINDAVDAAGNDGADGSQTDTYDLDTTAPSGYEVAWETDPVNASNDDAAEFTISEGEDGAGYNWEITSSGGGTAVNGSDTFSGTNSATLSNVDVSGLGDGTLTVTVYLTDGTGNQGNNATDDVTKDTSIPTVTASQSFNYDENQVIEYEIGIISASDTEGVTGFNITEGNGDNYFEIDNNGLLTLTATGAGSEANDFETGSNLFSLSITATDAAGNTSSTETVTINVDDVDETNPTVQNVTSAKPDGAYTVGEDIDITIEFSESVTVTTTGGTPFLELETGTTDRTATFVSGSESTTLIFRYTVQTGDESSDLDYTNTGALDLNGGSIRDDSDNDATLTLATPGGAGSLGANKDLVIDTDAPTLSSSTPNDNDAGVAVDTNVELTFSESVAAGTGAIELYATDGEELIESFDVETEIGTDPGQVNFDGTTVTINPTNDLDGVTSYYVQFAETAIDDAAGNSYAGISNQTDLNFETAAGPAASISLNGPVDVAAGEESGNFTLTVLDAQGNTTTVAQGTDFTLSSEQGGSTFNPTSPITVSSGNSSVTFNYTNATVGDGTHTISATWTSGGDDLGNATHDITVNPGAVSTFLVEAANGGNIAQQTAGNAFDIDITAQDANGNTLTGFTGTVDLTISKGTYASGGGETATFKNGVLENHTIQINTADTGYEIIATESGDTPSGSSNSFDVVANTATQMVITTQPTNETGNNDGEPVTLSSVVLETQDAHGNPSTVGLDEPQNVNVSISEGAGNLGGTTENVDINSGTATFGDLTLDSDGTFRLEFASADLGTVESNEFTINGISDASGFDAALAVAGNKTAGEAFDLSITNATDAAGDELDGSFDVTVASSVENEVHNASIDFTNGSATVPVTLDSAKVHNLTVSVTGISNDENLSVTVDPAAANYFTLSSAESKWTAGTSETITIKTFDEFGNLATGYEGNKDITFGGANTAPDGTTPTVTDKDGADINFTQQTTIVFTNGEATNIEVALFAVETANLTATDGTVSEDATLDITVGDAGLNIFLVQEDVSGGQNIATQTAGVEFDLKITARDEYENTVSDYTGTVDLSANGSAFGTGQAETTGSFTAGELTAFGVTLTQAAETVSISVEDSDDETKTGASNNFEVVAGTASALAFAQQPGNAASGAEIDPAVTVRFEDEFGNLTISTSTVYLSIGTDPSSEATLSGDTDVNAVSGIATFNDLSIDNAGEDYTLIASDAETPDEATGLTDAESNAFDITVGTPENLTINAGNNQTKEVAATLDDALQVKVTDSQGNAVSGVTLDFTISSTPEGTSGQSLSSATATTDGNGLASVELTLGQLVGTYEVEASVSNPSLGPVTFSATATPGAAHATTSLITAENGSITANGTSTTTITVQLKDQYENDLTSGGETVALSTTAGSLDGVNDEGDGTYTSTLTSSVTVETATITGTLNAVDITDEETVDFVAGNATQFVFRGTSSVTAGEVSGAITVTTQDGSGNTTDVSQETILELSSNSEGNHTFYSDVSGETEITQLTISADNSTATFYYSDEKAGTSTITGTQTSGDAIGNDTRDIEVGFAALNQFAVSLSSPQSNSEVFTGTNTITAQDVFGNTVEDFDASGDNVSLSLNTLTGALSGLGTGDDNVLDQGSDFVNGVGNLTNLGLIYTGTVGTGTITATAVSGSNGTSENLIIEAGDATQMVFSEQPGNTAAGATISPSVEVQLQDVSGNDVAEEGVSIGIISNQGTLSGTTPRDTDVNGVASFDDLSIAEANTGYQFIASSAGFDDVNSASFNITIGGISASESSVSADPTTLVADGNTASTLTIALKDANGNAVSGEEENIMLSGLSDATAGTISETGTAGTYEVDLTNTTAEEITVTVNADGTQLDEKPTITFEPGAISESNSSVTATSPHTANGTDASKISITLEDVNNNRISGLVNADFTLTYGDNASLSDFTEVGNGVYTYELTNAMAEEVTVTVSADGTLLNDTPSVTFKPGAISAGSSTVSVDPTSLTAGSNSTVIVTLQDAKNNAITGIAEADFTFDLTGDATLVANSFSNEGNGVYEVQVTDETAEEITVTVSVDEDGTDTEVGMATITFTADAAASIALSADPTGPVAGENTTLTATVTDQFGNLVSGEDVDFSLVSGNGSFDGASTDITISASGEATVTYTTDTTVETAQLRAELSDDSAINDDLDITSVAGTAAKYLITESATSVTAGEDVTVTAQLADANDNHISEQNRNVNWIASNGGSFSDEGATQTDEDGETTITFTVSGTAGTNHVVTATDDAGTNITGDSETITTELGGVTQLTFSGQPDDSTPAGDNIGTITVRLEDASGNLVEEDGTSIMLAISEGATLAGETTQVTTDGVATFDDFYVEEPGTGYKLKATSDGLEPDDSNDFDITRRAITVTADAKSKTYGEDNPELTYQVTSGSLITDVELSGSLDRASGEEAGTYEITRNDLINANNPSYDITYASKNLTIDPKDLTLSNFIADDKTYDGSTDVTGAGFNDDRETDDVLTFDYDVAFADADAGTDKDVNFTGITISGGSDQNNYNLLTTSGTATANITKAELTVSDASVDEKVYDGDTEATVSGATLDGVIGDDVVSLDALVGSFASANVANDIEVTAALTLTGTDASNYSLTQPTGLLADITTLELTITVNDAERAAGASNPVFSFEDFVHDLATGDDVADVTGGTGADDDVSYTLEETNEDSEPGEYTDEIGIDNTSIDGAKESNYNITVVPGTLTITPAALAGFDVEGIDDPTTAGAENAVTVTARDTEGNIKNDYTGTITFSSSDTEADLPAEYTFLAGDEGVKTFTDGVILKTAGDHWVQATDGDKTGRQEDITVNPAAAHTIVVSDDISEQTAGAAFDVDFTVEDEFENIVEDFTGQVNLSVIFGTIVPVNFEFEASDNGSKTLSVTIDEVGDEQKISGVLDTDESVTGETNEFEITTGAISASKSSVSVDPDEVVVGNNSTITITVRDGNENVIGDLAKGDFELNLSGEGELVGDSFEEDSEGVYTFKATNETAEEITVTVEVSDTELDDTPTIEFMNGDPLAENSTADVPNGTPGEETNITITILDQFGNPVVGVADLLKLSIEGANSEAEFSEIVDNGDGTYTVSYDPENAGTDQITIELDDTPISESPYTSEVQAINVDSMILVSGNEQEGRAGNQLSDSLVVQLLDEFENPVSGQTVSFSIKSSPSDTDSYELSGESSETDEDGLAFTRFTLGDLPGSYIVLAVFDELEVEFEMSATTDVPAKIELIAGNNQTQPTRSVLDDSLVVRVFDQFDNPVENVPVYFTFNSTPEDAIDQSVDPDTVSTTSGGFARTSVRLGSADGGYIVKAAVESDQVNPVLFTSDATFTAPNPTLIDTVNTVVFNGGLNSYMYAEFDESIDQTGFTYETWILPNSLDSDGYISKRWPDDDASNSQYRFQIVGNQLTVELMDAEGEVYTVVIDDFFRISGSDDSENNFMAASVIESNNEEENIEFSWTHFAVVADPAGETISIYRDGFEIERRQLNNELQSSDQRMEVGRGFDGEVHEVRLWSEIRTPREIQAFKDLILTGDEENLVLYHSFDEDNEDMSPDATNFNNDFYFTDDVGRNRSLRNVTRVTVNQDSDFAVRLAALDATGGTVNAEVTELPENGKLFQLDGNIQPTGEISSTETMLTDEFNRSLYVPDRDFAGTDSIKYKMYDQFGNFSTATLIFEVLVVNRPPVVDTVISKVQFPQREVFEVQLDTVVTDNVYLPEDMDWEIKFTDDRFDWIISADGVEKELNKEQALKEELERLLKERAQLINDRRGERTEIASNQVETIRANKPVGRNGINRLDDVLNVQGINTDNLSPDQIKDLLEQLNMGAEEEQRLIVEYNETDRLLRFTTTPLFYDENISMQVTATDPEGLQGRRDLLVTVDYKNDPPSEVSLLLPANLDSVHTNKVQFEWTESTSVEEEDIFYTLIIERQDGEQLLIEEITDTTYVFDDTADFFIEDFNYDWHVIATDKIDETISVDNFKFLTIQSVPFVYSLQNNYPNPFNPTTKVEYWIPVRSDVRLEVYDIIGRRVQVLVDETGVTPGTYTADFNGRSLASGVYFYRLTAQGENGSQFHRVKQMTLIK